MPYTTHIAEINQAESFARKHEQEAARASGRKAADHRLVANLYRQISAKLKGSGAHQDEKNNRPKSKRGSQPKNAPSGEVIRMPRRLRVVRTNP